MQYLSKVRKAWIPITLPKKCDLQTPALYKNNFSSDSRAILSPSACFIFQKRDFVYQPSSQTVLLPNRLSKW